MNDAALPLSLSKKLGQTTYTITQETPVDNVKIHRKGAADPDQGVQIFIPVELLEAFIDERHRREVEIRLKAAAARDLADANITVLK